MCTSTVTASFRYSAKLTRPLSDSLFKQALQCLHYRIGLIKIECQWRQQTDDAATGYIDQYPVLPGGHQVQISNRLLQLDANHQAAATLEFNRETLAAQRAGR